MIIHSWASFCESSGPRALEFLHFPIPVLRARLDQFDLRCAQVEQAIDPRVELRFQPDDLSRALFVCGAAREQPFFPVVALPYRNLALERLARLGQEAGEVQRL